MTEVIQPLLTKDESDTMADDKRDNKISKALGGLIGCSMNECAKHIISDINDCKLILAKSGISAVKMNDLELVGKCRKGCEMMDELIAKIETMREQSFDLWETTEEELDETVKGISQIGDALFSALKSRNEDESDDKVIESKRAAEKRVNEVEKKEPKMPKKKTPLVSADEWAKLDAILEKKDDEPKEVDGA